MKDLKSRSAAGRESYPAATAKSRKDRHTACAPLTSWGWTDQKTSLTSGQSSAATAGPSGASHDRTAGDAGRNGRTGAACPNNGGRYTDATAGTPPCAGVVPEPPAAAGDAADPTKPLVAAATPAWRGGFRHSRPLGYYGSRKPGGNVGRAGTGGRALVGPGVAGVAGKGIAPDAASAADRLSRGTTGRTSARSVSGRVGDASDGATPGLSGGVAGDGSISAEGHRVLREPVVGGGAAGGAPEVRRTRRGVGGADEVGLGRNWDGGPAYERRGEPAKGRAWPRRPPRGPSSRGRRARQATTDRAPRGGCSALRAERSLPLVCNDRFGGLCMHGGHYLHWLVMARVKSLSGNWARAAVSALSGRRATTVGGTVVAGK